MGFIGGAALALIIIAFFALRKRFDLKSCLASDSAGETFSHKGRLYDKQKYMKLYSARLAGSKLDDLYNAMNNTTDAIRKRPDAVIYQIEMLAIKDLINAEKAAGS